MKRILTTRNLGVLVGSVFGLILLGCSTIPPKAEAVQDFKVEKYLGTWYEIARIDFKFEKNLIKTTAQYSKNQDGSIAVLNQGYHVIKNKWKQAEGKAKFVESSDIAKLKVSFFGPFYAGYNVIAIDPDYQYALVAGKNLDYLWILSREKHIPESVKESYLEIAQKVGYDVSRLLWVEQ